jgi:hypothetical protein
MLNRFTPAALAAALAALAACSDADQPVAPDVQPDLARSGQPVPTRQEQRGGTFIELSDAQLWTAVQEGGGRVMVGLKAPGGARGVWQGKVLVDRGTWTQGSAAVLAQRGAYRYG